MAKRQKRIVSSVTELDFTQSDFRNIKLSGLDISGYDFTNKDLSGAELRFTNCSNCNFSGAKLRYTDLNGANFTGANLTGANLFSTNINYAIGWSEAELSQMVWPRHAVVFDKPDVVPGLPWPSLLFGSHLAIGCELHKVREWISFTKQDFEKMYGGGVFEIWNNNLNRTLLNRDMEAEYIYENIKN